ncbi:hypothetical protein ACFEOL_004826, partial [Salmonella enterica]
SLRRQISFKRMTSMTNQNDDRDRNPLDYSENSKSERAVASGSDDTDAKNGSSEPPEPLNNK